MKIGLIGLGVMGQAIAEALLKKNITTRRELFLCDKNPRKLENFSLGQCFNDPTKLTAKISVLIIAVKPQDSPQVLKCLRDQLSSQQLLISIMAGVPIKKIEELTNHQQIIRAMPNTPVRIGQGATGWAAHSKVNPTNIRRAKKIFASFGVERRVGTEKDLDTITAISGSGPAYFYFLTELLQQKATQMGLSKTTAAKLARQAFIGAAALITRSDKSPAELRHSVTSKGGTTEAALKILGQKNFTSSFAKAVQAAAKKSHQLSRQR